MGLVTSRLNLESLHVGGLRSQQDEVCFSYSLGKNYFSNYFLMGGERYEVNDPDYLFGDNCDLNFLGCNKPYSIPYKKAQQYLLASLKQSKSCNKVSSRVSRLSSPLSILTTNATHNNATNPQQPDNNQRQQTTADLRKHDAQQTQTLTSSKESSSNPEPSQPLVMLVNIRKETIRLVKSPSTTDFPQQDGTTIKCEHEISSLVSASSSTRSGYTSVRGEEMHEPSDADDDEDEYKDALNDGGGGGEDTDSEKTQQQESLLPSNGAKSNKEDCGDIRITIEYTASTSEKGPPGASKPASHDGGSVGKTSQDKTCPASSGSDTRVYNIEFSFDTEVDCSIRIFYFCTRETTSTGITYKPMHATYKSKVYYYKKGLNQKFEQPEHTFQPYLFDEDLLIYKPLDMEGTYNSGSVFPIVIQCVALDGPMPRQSHSLVATIEKSQLDGSYSIKPLKQLIFADGLQFILQDIYGIENKQLLSKNTSPKWKQRQSSDGNNSGLKYKSHSLQSNLSDTTSFTGPECSLSSRGLNRGSTSSNNQPRSLGGENTFECVICISEERDTMLLPCRHLCLCISCAQSLRYQANSCPICRSPFRAALNIRRSAAHLSDREDLGRN